MAAGADDEMSDDGVSVAQSDPKRGTPRLVLKALRASRNVGLTMVYQFFDGAAFSVWQMVVLQKLIFDLSDNSNAVVGYVAGVGGALQVLSSLTASTITDRCGIPRQVMCRLAVIAAIAGVASLTVAVAMKHVVLFYVASGFWGLYQGTGNPAVEALMADSVSSTTRAATYTVKYVVQVLCYLVGNSLNITLFLVYGDRWHFEELSTVIYVGMGVHVFAILWLFTLRDSAKLHTETAADDAALLGAQPASPTPDVSDVPSDSVNQEPLPEGSLSGSGARPTDDRQQQQQQNGQRRAFDTQVTLWSPVGDGATEEPSDVPLTPRSLGAARQDSPLTSASDVPTARRSAEVTATGSPLRVRHKRHRRPSASSRSGLAVALLVNEKVEPFGVKESYFRVGMDTGRHWLWTPRGVPYWIVSGDLLSALGAGMTVRFLPLFFIDRYNVSPIYLTLVYTIITCAMAVGALAAKAVASKILHNRAATVGVFRFTASLCTAYLGLAKGGAEVELLMIAVLIGRQVAANSVFGLSRSIIMDHVPSTERARWSAMESVASFSWAGSAVVGGLIADAHGYRVLFRVTAVIQCIASLLTIPAATQLKDTVFKHDDTEVPVNVSRGSFGGDAEASA